MTINALMSYRMNFSILEAWYKVDIVACRFLVARFFVLSISVSVGRLDMK